MEQQNNILDIKQEDNQQQQLQLELGQNNQNNCNQGVQNNDQTQENQEQNQQQIELEQKKSEIQKDFNLQSQKSQKYFCTLCRKIVENKCRVENHNQNQLITIEQLEDDFNKYKLFQEQNDPLYNISKSLQKIQEVLKYMELESLKKDYELKQKIFEEDSKIEDFLDKVVYKQDRLVIDDQDVQKDVDQLKKEQHLIDLINTNYQIIKQFLPQQNQQMFDYKQQQQFQQGNFQMPNMKNTNQSDDSDNEMDRNCTSLNTKRRISEDFPFQQNIQESNQNPLKKIKSSTDNGMVVNQYQNNFQNQPIQNNNNNIGQQQQSINDFSEFGNEQQQQSQVEVDKNVGLNHMSPKEQEILHKMYNTQYEKHHRFTEVEKNMFAKFALLRKIKDGINVSVTTEQWKLNRITVQLWLDKYKKQLKSKHEN